MPRGVLSGLTIEPPEAHPRKVEFECGVTALDRYLRSQASQDARNNVAAPFVALATDDAIAGFYTLSATALDLSALPEAIARKPPRYPLVPATLLGRLAVDRRWQGQGVGRFLLADALWRAARSEIASYAVIVEAKDDGARRFYESESFLSLPKRSNVLFRRMSDIRALFA